MARSVVAFMVVMVVDEEVWWDGALAPGVWVLVGSLYGGFGIVD